MNIIKYEAYKRNKAILSLLWDLDARPHEVTLLKIKHIRIGKISNKCVKMHRWGEIINHWECLFCQEEHWKKQGLIKQNKVK